MTTHKISLSGMITGGGYGQWLRDIGEKVILPEDVTNAVTKANKEGLDLEVDLTTNGGSVMNVGEMVAELAKLEGKSQVNIQGMVASAGTILASAFNKATMSEFSYFLIHNPRFGMMGTVRTQDAREMLAQLEAMTESSIDVYQQRTGLDRAVIADYMDKESMFNAKQAKELKFVDEIVPIMTSDISESNFNPLLAIKQADDKYQKLYEQYQGELNMSKEELPVVEEGVVEEQPKAEATVEEVAEAPKLTTDDKLDALLSAVNGLVEALTKKAEQPKQEVTETVATEVVEPVVEEVVEEVIIKPAMEATQTFATQPNMFGFDTAIHRI